MKKHILKSFLCESSDEINRIGKLWHHKMARGTGMDRLFQLKFSADFFGKLTVRKFRPKKSGCQFSEKIGQC